MEVPEKAGKGVRGLGEPVGRFIKKFHQNQTRGSMLNSQFLSFFGSKTPLIMVDLNLV